MTTKDAKRCVALLEKAFKWKVYFYWCTVGGKDRCFYDIKRAGFGFYDNNSLIMFGEDGTGRHSEEGSPTKSDAAKAFAGEVSGNTARDINGMSWRVPEFSSAAELKLKLAAEGRL